MTLPLLLSQMGDTGTIKIYEMNVCSKMILLTSSAINSILNPSEKIASSSWTFEGNLLTSDYMGNIYFVQSDGKRRYQVVESKLTKSPSWKPLIADFRCGVAVVNSRSQISVRK